MKPNLYLGLMSGTSVNAIDGALVNFDRDPWHIISTHSLAIDHNLRQEILNACQSTALDLTTLARLDVQLGQLFAKTALSTLAKTNIDQSKVAAIGCHGQTIRHAPRHEFPFTWQIGDPNIIASRTGIPTVADFRRRDVALGGQGAPLTPAFHQAMLRHPAETRFVVNLGGMANVTVLPPADSELAVIGFDTGPGNVLLDAWCQQWQNKPYDAQGQWAASGKVQTELLAELTRDQYFATPPPKSTGREYFNLSWLEQTLSKLPTSFNQVDVQTTLTELTAHSVAKAILDQWQQLNCPKASVWVCGGGWYNDFLIQRLRERCQPLSLQSTQHIGIDPLWVEAVAFAWLAKQTQQTLPGNLPSVTGATRSTVLGAIYPV